ncbi:MAG: hypothetical protein ACPGUV_06645 [Polyangiales bacterium]
MTTSRPSTPNEAGLRTGGDELRLIIVAVAVLSLLATAVVLLYGSELGAPKSQNPDSYDRGPLGHHGWQALIEALGIPARRSRMARDFTAAPLWLSLEASQLRAQLGGERFELDQILTRRAKAQRLSVVVLPKWRRLSPFEQQRRRDKAKQAELLPHDDPLAVKRVEKWWLQRLLRKTLQDDDIALRQHRDRRKGQRGDVHRVSGPLGHYQVQVPRLQVLADSPRLEPLLRSPQGSLVAAVHTPAGQWWVVSDPDLLHNFNFHRAEHARLWHDFLHHLWRRHKGGGAAGKPRVTIDEVFHGHGLSPSLGAALGRMPAVLIVVQLLLMALVAVWRGLRRTAPVQWEPPVHGRGPEEAVAVASTLLALGRRNHALSQAYAGGLLDDLHAQLFAPRHPRAVQQEEMTHAHDQALDALARTHGLEAMACALRAATEAHKGRPSSDKAALQLAGRAWRFAQALGQAVLAQPGASPAPARADAAAHRTEST